ncbi:MAG TPA: biotin/lipoyl-binding protein, partial [Candidatus Acidoferrum sp.]|nr:biotin/lipoyl-binding protein [Candidatus Acidoferrum sp.]
MDLLRFGNRLQYHLRHLSLPMGILLLALAPAFWGCSSGPAERAGAETQPAIPVSVSPVTTKSVPVQVRANGTVQPIATVTVMGQVDGQVSQIHFTEGQEVRQGDLLFTLDQRPFEATLQQA